MIIPEDGCFPQITSSNLNAFNNIMIVKVDDKWIKPGETTFQFATLDRSKKGTIWPADNYISKMIPDLPENKILDEHKKAYESRKELNMSKKTTARPQLVRQRSQIRYHFLTPKPKLPRKNWSDKPDKHERFPPKPDINISPWLPQWSPCMAPEEGVTKALLATPSDGCYNFPIIANNSFQGFGPPGEFNNMRHNLSNPLPSSSNSFQNDYMRDYSPTVKSFNVFDEMPPASPIQQYPNNNYRHKSRNGPNSNRFYQNNFPRKANNHGPVHHDHPNYMHENDVIGRNLHIPHSFTDQNMGDSVPYDNVANLRNGSKNNHYPHAQSNRKQWRNGGTFKHHANSRNNVNSKGNVNSNPRVNMDSTPREDMSFFNSGENVNTNYMIQGKNNSFKAKRNKNLRQRYNAYNKNQRKSWNTNKAQNFKQSHLNQNTNQNFRASNPRQ